MPLSPQYARILVLTLYLSIQSALLKAQECPANIDFEQGSLDRWTCYTGTVQANGTQNVINLFPSGIMPGQHTLFSAFANAGELDEYGGFPVVCPNGSGYSVKLGNTSGGAQAEGLSYDFTIPAGRNTYSLIYNYAVVFQDPNHQEFQQPRLVLEVWNKTDNQLIDCSSFTFFPNGSPLPGFFVSPQSDTIPVWCKDWSAVSINLNGMAGKDIQLFFKTTDCTFRRHFGYAYIDVNSECSSEFTGAVFCPDDTAVLVTAPYGYQAYHWYNHDFSQQLGQQQTLSFSQPPPSGTLVAVELIPYNGYGCLDTLYARLLDTLRLRANAGTDVLSCNGNPVLIGSNRKPNVLYSWSPATGLSNPAASNPSASPPVTTAYELTVMNMGGGCRNKDTVIVNVGGTDSSLQVLGKTLFCIHSGDSAVLVVNPADSIQWYRNNTALTGANAARLRVTQGGNYRAQLFSAEGCTASTRTQTVTIETPRPGIRYPDKSAVMNFPLSLQARDFGSRVRWNPSIWLDDPSVTSPVFQSPALQDFSYGIEITTAAGCVTIDSQVVKTVKEVRLDIPTAFTPNNDGRNDYLRPMMIGVKELKFFRIYDRWGQLVYEGQPGQRGWDGTRGGLPQNSGIYVWIVEATGLDNRPYFKKGTVALIR